MEKNSTVRSLEDRFYPLPYVKEAPPGWQEKKNMAANTAAQSIISNMPKNESNPYATSDSDDSDASEYNAQSIKKFANALKSNYIVDSTFHDVSDSKFCFCL